MQIKLKEPADDSGNMYSGIIQEKDIQKIQDRFCDVVNLFVFCTDDLGQHITEMSGNQDEVLEIKKLIKADRFMELCDRVAGNSLEEQVVENTPHSNIKLAAVTIKVNKKSMMNWLICAVLSDDEETENEKKALTEITTKIERKKFYDALDLLRRTSTVLLEARVMLSEAEAENRRSRSSEKEMGLSLKRSEAISSVVQLLESNKPIETIMQEILRTTGEYLNVSSAQVFRLNIEGNTMDVLSEWCNRGIVSAFDKIRNIERSYLLTYNKPTAISADTKVSPKEREALDAVNIKAMIMIPIMIEGTISMCVCFNECTTARTWQIDEIKLTNNVAKILQSIVSHKIQSGSISTSFASFETILDTIGSAIYVKDVETKEVVFVNKMLKTNFAEEYADGTIDKLFEEGKPVGNKSGTFEINHIVRNRWYDLHYTYTNWIDGRSVALCSVFDITDRKVYQKKVEQQAYTDFLTGLYNRMCCERDLAWQIDNAKKFGLNGALLYLDLDDFKHINDGLGHQYGDVLLKSISYHLQKIEGIEATCYRMGGDEFVILVPPGSYSRLTGIMEEIKEIFSKPWFLKDADYYCTMSMGVVKFPVDGESVQNLIKKADIAMYEAKRTGKNRVVYYTEKLNTVSNKRLDIEKNMRDATVAGYKEFEIYYQPIIDIQKEGTPCCTGAEALLRWNSTKLGFMQPSDFIPLAEYLGLINPIGNYVLKEACLACKYWNEHGYPDYKVNVNLSVVQLLQPDIVEIVEKTLKETGVISKNLTLEVTESLAINDMERMKEILANIKKLEVRIALDDFGIGYSSLNHIKEIPFDVIKVDQSFVTDLAEDAYSQSFIKMIAELANSIGVSICVEGIESKEQYKVLEGMNVQLIQGYYFDRPMTREAFEHKYLKSRCE